MCVLQLLSCYPYVHDTLNWRMVADKKSQLPKSKIVLEFGRRMPMSILLNTQILSYLMSHFNIFTE